ncbi:MAG: hypothetical protein PHC34_13680 [Candidatus Gastranaerophilales bacterium]|nr:hypothetical protein [Candidatus Gastranaerophilales bacterium]
MNLRVDNSYSPYTKSNVTFGHNQGVLDAIEVLKKRVTPDRIDELQAQLQDVKFTPDFVNKISEYSDHWKQVLVKYANPKEIQDGLKRIFGMK